MATRKLEKSEWQSFFDSLSKELEGEEAEIEVSSLRLGNQVAADWLPLIGITYDPKDDLLEVALEGLDHMIRKPAEIYVQIDENVLESIEVVDADGVKQIVKLKDELDLPTADE